MSYESSIIELGPALYCPIFVFNDNGPVDIISRADSVIQGSFFIENSNLFPKRSIVLTAGSFIDVETAGVMELFDLPISYSFWFNKGSDPGPVFSIGEESEGFAISINENNNIVVFYDGFNSDTLIESVSDEFHLITVSIDAIPFGDGEDGEDSFYPFLVVYFDGKIVYSTEQFSFPADYDIFFNSFYGEPGDSQTKISQYFIIPKALDDNEAQAIYDLAKSGKQLFSLESDTRILYSDINQIALQTSWQAYGIVTGKQ
jgi:hypothetical protein